MKCELCSMEGNNKIVDQNGVTHYYCDHHVPKKENKATIPIGTMLKIYRPLILVFIAIIILTIITQNLFNWGQGMNLFMGYFFLVFGFLKVIAWKNFIPAFQAYDPLAKNSKLYATVYPALELVLAAAFLTGIFVNIAAVITIIVLTATSIGVHGAIKRKQNLQCVCLGPLLSLPLSYITILENVLMVVMAIITLLK